MVEGIGLEIRQVAQAARGFKSLLLRFDLPESEPERVQFPPSPLFLLSGGGKQFYISFFTLEKYPSWPKGHPWKGCRSLIAARGFKSLLLRSLKIKDIFLLTRDFFSDNITKLPKKTVARNGSLITEQQCNPEKIPNLKVLSEGFKGRTIQRTKPRNSKVSESQLKLAQGKNF